MALQNGKVLLGFSRKMSVEIFETKKRRNEIV